MTKPEIVRNRLKRDMKYFLEHHLWYNETERENMETCEKFLQPVNKKFEQFNLRHPEHSERKPEREY